jgi:predicted DCC family thiol-disulfide oxidoreductase YuxK
VKNWQIELLYDGECPLCLREVNFLRSKDRGRGLVNFVDIAQPDYNPLDHGGVSFEDAMARIHGVKADGSVVKNVAVFREVYEILGIGWLYAPTRWPIIGPLVDRIYDFWADRRLSWTGRSSLAEILAQREKGMCAADGCALPVTSGTEGKP